MGEGADRVGVGFALPPCLFSAQKENLFCLSVSHLQAISKRTSPPFIKSSASAPGRNSIYGICTFYTLEEKPTRVLPDIPIYILLIYCSLAVLADDVRDVRVDRDAPSVHGTIQASLHPVQNQWSQHGRRLLYPLRYL